MQWWVSDNTSYQGKQQCHIKNKSSGLNAQKHSQGRQDLRSKAHRENRDKSEYIRHNKSYLKTSEYTQGSQNLRYQGQGRMMTH